MELSNVTIGADPELFIINEKTKKVVSAVGLIPGEKGNPWRSDDMPEGFGLETDNILADFNIPRVTDEINFVNNVVNKIYSILNRRNVKFCKNIVSLKSKALWHIIRSPWIAFFTRD